MAEIRTNRTARKSHRCGTFNCYNIIVPGQRYIRVAIPPGNSDICNTKWWTMNVCQSCMTLGELNNV